MAKRLIMKQAYVETFVGEKGFMGFKLKADFCTEHESGIQPMREWLNLPYVKHVRNSEDLKQCRPRRIKLQQMSQYTKSLDDAKMAFFQGEGKAALMLRTPANIHMGIKAPWNISYLPGDVKAAWDEERFALVATTPETIQQLRWLANAFANGNAVVHIENGGLCLGIYNHLI